MTNTNDSARVRELGCLAVVIAAAACGAQPSRSPASSADDPHAPSQAREAGAEAEAAHHIRMTWLEVGAFGVTVLLLSADQEGVPVEAYQRFLMGPGGNALQLGAHRAAGLYLGCSAPDSDWVRPLTAAARGRDADLLAVSDFVCSWRRPDSRPQEQFQCRLTVDGAAPGTCPAIYTLNTDGSCRIRTACNAQESPSLPSCQATEEELRQHGCSPGEGAAREFRVPPPAARADGG